MYTRLTTLVLAAFAGTGIAMSGTETPDSTDIDRFSIRPTVVVTATRVPVDLVQAARTIDVITVRDLERIPMRSIQDALVLVPGVDLRTRGPFGAQADISTRGGSFEQTAVLLDGMRLTDAQTGHHQLNLPLAPYDLDRIEVVKGGASRLFGPGAMDGVVNLVPRTPASSSMRASLLGGDFGYVEARLSGALRTGDVVNSVSAQRVQHNGYRRSSDLALTSALLTGSLNGDSARLSWIGGVVDKAFGAGLYYTPRFPDAWERTVTWLGGLKGQMTFDPVWSTTVMGLVRVNSDEFLLDRNNPSFYRNTHTTYATTLTALTTAQWERVGLTLGVEGGTDRITSSNLGDHDRVRGGVSAELRGALTEEISATLGGNLIAFSDRTPGYGFGADVQWRLTEFERVFATVNRSYRIPTYTDLYYRDPTTRGNAALRPEFAITAEIGASTRVESVDLRGSVFYRDGQDLIDYVLREDGLYYAENIEHVRFTGVEAGPTAFVTRWWSSSPLTMLRWTVNYASVESAATAETRYTRDQLRWQSIVRADVALPAEIYATFTLRFVERYTDRVMRSVGDLRFYRTFGVTRFIIEASNLWSTSMVEVGWVPIAPRWFRAGIEAAID